MGMCTEFSFAAEVDSETAKSLQDFYEGKTEFPRAGFFAKPRALMLLGGWSAYSMGSSVPLTVAPEGDDDAPTSQVSFRTSFKNYDDEIDAFLHFITPHVIYGAGEMNFVGYHLYEEHVAPTLHFIQGGRHVALIPPSAHVVSMLTDKKEN